MTYHWLGQPGPGNASIWLETAITPTRTILTVEAGPMRLNVTFLSPIEVRCPWRIADRDLNSVYGSPGIGRASRFRSATCTSTARPRTASRIRSSCILILAAVRHLSCRIALIITQYTRISNSEWVTNDLGTGIQWSSSQRSNTVFHQVWSTTSTFTFKDIAEDAIAYHAISSVSASTHSHPIFIISPSVTGAAQPGLGRWN
jgi:hypothetical protein